MPPVRVRTLGAALLVAATIAACAGPKPTAPTIAPTPSVVRTTPSLVADAGAVSLEVGGPPGVQLTISWGVGSVTAHTEHPAPWSRTEIAPMESFSVTLQASLPPASDGNVSCRITVEGKEVANKTLPGGALCTAMNLSRHWNPGR